MTYQLSSEEQEFKATLEQLQSELTTWNAFWTWLQSNHWRFSDAQIEEFRQLSKDFSDRCDAVHAAISGDLAEA
jgi:hypothetical protein